MCLAELGLDRAYIGGSTRPSEFARGMSCDSADIAEHSTGCGCERLLHPGPED